VLKALHEEELRVTGAEEQLDERLRGTLEEAKAASKASDERLAPLLEAIAEQERSSAEDVADIEAELASAHAAANRTTQITERAAHAALRAAEAASSQAYARDSRQAAQLASSAARSLERRTQLARQAEKLREAEVDAMDTARRAELAREEAATVLAAAEEWGEAARKIGAAAEQQMSPGQGLLRDAMGVAMGTLNQTAHALLWLQARVDAAASVLGVTADRAAILERQKKRVSHLAAVYLDHSIHQVRSAVHRLGAPHVDGGGRHGHSASVLPASLETSLAAATMLGPSATAKEADQQRRKDRGTGAVL